MRKQRYAELRPEVIDAPGRAMQCLGCGRAQRAIHTRNDTIDW